jgi:hypothetical protein
VAQAVPEALRPSARARKVTLPGMPHWQRTWVLVALSALGIMLPACHDGTDLSCSTDLDCLESEVCHPDQKVCVQVCTTSADCPEEAKTCAVMFEGARVKTCQCLTRDCMENP